METLYEPILRRALALLDGQANLADLAAVVWHWSPMDEKRPNDPRRQMAYDYYAASPL
jgi:CRISPR system Cascade subunit CasB